MGSLITRECEHCGGFLLRERLPFGGDFEVTCVLCGRSASTPRREPTAEEREGGAAEYATASGRLVVRRRRQTLERERAEVSA